MDFVTDCDPSQATELTSQDCKLVETQISTESSSGAIMSVLKPRNRLVYFRVTEDEFQQLNLLCQSTGAHSISDLARCAVRTLMDARGNHADPVSDRLYVLETQVDNLNQRILQLVMTLGGNGFRATSPRDGAQDPDGGIPSPKGV